MINRVSIHILPIGPFLTTTFRPDPPQSHPITTNTATCTGNLRQLLRHPPHYPQTSPLHITTLPPLSLPPISHGLSVLSIRTTPSLLDPSTCSLQPDWSSCAPHSLRLPQVTTTPTVLCLPSPTTIHSAATRPRTIVALAHSAAARRTHTSPPPWP